MKKCKKCNENEIRHDSVTGLCRNCFNKERAKKCYAIKNCKVCNEPFEVFRTRDLEEKILCSRKCVSAWLSSDESQAKTKATNLERRGVEFSLQSEEVREKGRQAKKEKYGDENYVNHEKAKQTNLERYQVEYPTQNEDVKEKSKQTCLEKYGVEYSLQSDVVREKGIITSFEKYGVKSPIQNEEIKQRSKNTKKERYGDENFNNRELAKETTLEIYGFDNVSKVEEIKIKKEETLMKNYGVKNYSQTEGFGDEVKAAKLKNHGDENYTNPKQTKETCLELYGVENPMQTPEVHLIQQKSGLQAKKYNNTDIYYRGSYELHFLELMDNKELLGNLSNGKSFKYMWKDERKVYHSDFNFDGTTVEIKSSWTYNKNGKDLELQAQNEAKWQAVRDLNENIIILKNKQEIETFVQSLPTPLCINEISEKIK